MKNPEIIICVVFICIIAAIAVVCLIVYAVSNREKKEYSENLLKSLSVSFITLSHGPTSYELEGPDTAYTIVLMHGGTIPLWVWDPQFKQFAEAGFRTLRYDQYGRGLSARPKTDYDRALYRSQLKELLDSLGIHDSVFLVGLCQGAAFAADFAVKFPSRISGVVLISPYNEVARYKTAITTGIVLTRMPVLGRFLLRCAILPKIIERASGYVKECNMDIEYYNRLFNEQIIIKGFESALFSYLRSDATGSFDDAYKGLGRSGIPVLFIRGENDDNITKEMADDELSLLGDVQSVTFKGCGHQPNWEKPEIFNKMIFDFIKKVIA